jgi:hypothetical protein
MRNTLETAVKLADVWGEIRTDHFQTRLHPYRFEHQFDVSIKSTNLEILHSSAVLYLSSSTVIHIHFVPIKISKRKNFLRNLRTNERHHIGSYQYIEKI